MTLGFLLNPRLVLWTMYQPLGGSASDLCSTNLSNSRVSLEVAVWAKQLQRRLRPRLKPWNRPPSCVETSKLRSVIWWLSFKDEEPQIMIMYLYILCNTHPTLSIFSSIRICSRRNFFFFSQIFFCWFGQPKRIVWQKSLFLFPQIILLWRRRLLLNSPSFSTFGRLQKFSIFCTMYNCHARWSIING